jgi:preprotein translocase subunit SecD
MNEGMPVVSLEFNQTGAKKFFEITSKNIGKHFAVVLDKEVITAPRMQVAIRDGKSIITGNFTLSDANELALLLRAGSLPAPLKVIEEKTVGPSLGADSIHAGVHSTLIAFVLVAGFMVFSYRLFGVFANVSLMLNLILVFACLSVLQATLTLPGIAGIALTIGMAVDANVLIFERIKEELRMGAKPILAIDAGFKRAITTIMDSNITTLIVAFVMYLFGTGPVRGFAVTLTFGIVTSLFTAISLTRLIIVKWVGKKRITHLPIGV